MGSFDCYCALCGGPLNIGAVSFGSRKSKAMQRRNKKVAKQIKARRNVGDDINDEMGAVNDAGEMDVEDDEIVEIPNPFAKQKEASWGDTDDEDGDVDMENEDEDSNASSDTESIHSTDSDFHPGGIADVRLRPPSPDPRSLRDPDCWSQWSEPSIWEGFNPYKSSYGDDSKSMASYEEEHSYNPEKLQADNVRWLNRCRALSFNPDASGVSKAYISGRGRYDDYGGFRIIRSGRDPNDTGEEYLVCFHAWNPDETASFPFHEECFKILARVLGYERYQAVDKDILYGVMTAHTDDREMNLPYGDISGQEQFWECIPGEEFSVFDPGLRLGFEDALQSMLPASLFDDNPRLSIPMHKVRHDLFYSMPYDILLDVFEYLEVSDMLALISASACVFQATYSTAFWKHMLRLYILPWFWELRKLLENVAHSETFDYKGLFTWIESVTRPEYGIEGTFMGIANRRRIWQSCQPLVSMYKEQVDPIPHGEPDDEEAKIVLDRAESFHMPVVSYPLPKGAATVSAQLIRSWHEIAHRSCDFDTYWNDDGALVGIAVTFGISRRVLGSTDGRRGRSLHIGANEWIQEIRVKLRDCDMFDEGPNRSHYTSALDTRACGAGKSYVEGMEIVLTSGQSQAVRICDRNTRSFTVLEGMYLIGLTGQIAPNGLISRLGLLQSRHPDSHRVSPSPVYTPAQKLLWGPSALHLLAGASTEPRVPIWRNPFYNVDMFSSEPARYEGGDLPSAMLPYHILLWSENSEQNRSLRRISAFTVEAGFCSRGNDRWPVPDLLGFAAFRSGEEGAAQHVGTFGPVPSQSPEWGEEGWYGKRFDQNGKPIKPLNPSDLNLSSRFKSFDEEHTSHFDVDGHSGEEVSEIHVSTDYKAIKLKTNKGRGCYWGEGRRDQWFVKVANHDECIVGLSVCFGRLGGWSWRAKMYSHWKVSDLGVVFARRDGAAYGV